MGEYQPKVRGEKGRVNTGAPIPDYYPEVIDPETFWRAQGVLQARSTLKIRGREGRNVANLFTGLMRDATDGSPMLYKHTTAGRYIDSERAWNGEKRGNGFRYRIFEESLLIFLRDDLTLGAADTSARRREREALEAELCACEARLRRTVATMVACDDADVHASLSEVLAQQTRQKKALQEQVERARGEERLDQAAGLQATKSVIVAYYHAREKEEVFGGLLDDLKRETGKKPTPEIREIEDRFRARHWGDLRSQIKNKIRGLIAEIWVLVKAEGWRRKTALVELHFRQGAVKALEITVDPSGEVTRWVIEPPGLKRSPPRGA
jgi:hypothetical protein